MKKILYIILGVILTVIILAWAPWITKSNAEKIVINNFEAKWNGVMDGCGFNCDGCGVQESHKTLFGYTVTIKYGCGMLIVGNPSGSVDKIFVSFLGTSHTVSEARF